MFIFAIIVFLNIQTCKYCKDLFLYIYYIYVNDDGNRLRGLLMMNMLGRYGFTPML